MSILDVGRGSVSTSSNKTICDRAQSVKLLVKEAINAELTCLYGKCQVFSNKINFNSSKLTLALQRKT